MAWFRRKNNLEATNLEQYYAAQHRQGPMSWLMVGLALLTTAVIILGLFWGAGWLYKKAKHTDKTTTTSITTKKSDTSSVAIDSNGNVGGAVKDNSDAQQPTTPGITTPDTKPATSTDPSSTTQTTPAPTVATTTPSTTKLPSTGPGNIVSLFAIVATLAGAAHHFVRRHI